MIPLRKMSKRRLGIEFDLSAGNFSYSLDRYRMFIAGSFYDIFIIQDICVCADVCTPVTDPAKFSTRQPRIFSKLKNAFSKQGNFIVNYRFTRY